MQKAQKLGQVRQTDNIRRTDSEFGFPLFHKEVFYKCLSHLLSLTSGL